MKKLFWLISVTLVCLLSQVEAVERFAILYSGSVMGETEPCG